MVRQVLNLVLRFLLVVAKSRALERILCHVP